MSTTRVFHLPHHLTYAAKLAGAGFAPVVPAHAPTSVRALLDTPSWDFFDVLHLHTIELASSAQIERLTARLAREGRGFVFTAHDTQPNIESPSRSFTKRTELALRLAGAAVTLTHAAARQLHERCGAVASTMRVVPHGYAIAPGSAPLMDGRATGFAIFGALRPNRALLAAAGAWQRLEPPRPSLRILLRSVRAPDRERDGATLAALQAIAASHPALELEIHDTFVSQTDLLRWLCGTRTLILPYTRITHSGQLELARDLGLRLLAPDVETLRAQAGDAAGVTWYRGEELMLRDRFRGRLEHAAGSPWQPPARRSAFAGWRAVEHQAILEAYQHAYTAAMA